MKNTSQTDFVEIFDYKQPKKGNNKNLPLPERKVATDEVINSLPERAKSKLLRVDMELHLDYIKSLRSVPVGNDIFCVKNETQNGMRQIKLDISRSEFETELLSKSNIDALEVRQIAIKNAESGCDHVDLVEGFVLLPGYFSPVLHCWLFSQQKRTIIDPISAKLGFDLADVKYFPGCYIPESVYYNMNTNLLLKRAALFPLMASQAYDAEQQMLKALVGCIRFGYNRILCARWKDFPKRFTSREAWAQVSTLKDAISVLKQKDHNDM